MERSRKRLKPIYERIIEALKRQPVLHSDETGCPIAGKKGWFWIFAMKIFCACVASKSRGFKVIRETIGEGFKGSWVSDRFTAQLNLPIINNCWTKADKIDNIPHTPLF